MIYFTSDLHLGHEAVIRMQNRPFANADEMNQVLIENYNSVVHKDDTVYLLGDCHRNVGFFHVFGRFYKGMYTVNEGSKLSAYRNICMWIIQQCRLQEL